MLFVFLTRVCVTCSMLLILIEVLARRSSCSCCSSYSSSLSLCKDNNTTKRFAHAILERSNKYLPCNPLIIFFKSQSVSQPVFRRFTARLTAPVRERERLKRQLWEPVAFPSSYVRRSSPCARAPPRHMVLFCQRASSVQGVSRRAPVAVWLGER